MSQIVPGLTGSGTGGTPARRFAAWVLIAAAVGTGCGGDAKTAPTVVVRVTPTAAERLEDAFRALPALTPETVEAEGSIAAIRALQAREVDLVVVMADIAYHAYVGQTRTKAANAQIRGIAVLNVNTVYLAVAPKSDVRFIQDLRGRRVGLGSASTATSALATLLLKASGVGLDRVHLELSPYPEALKHLADGTLDAAFLSFNVSVQAAAEAGARLIPIKGEWVEQLRQQTPFLQTVLVPAGTYPGQHEALQTVGVDLILASGDHLDEDVVYRLSKAYFGGLQRSAPATDLERAPATPIPLHPGAARYYRERALSR